MSDHSQGVFTHLTALDKSVLQKLARSLGSHVPVVVEIGSYLGESACILADAVSRMEGRVFCVDTWTNMAMGEGPRDTFAEFTHNTQGFKHIISAIRADSVEAAKKFAYEIDLLFIDGDHSLEGCSNDLLCWLPKVRNGGVVALHGFGWADGVRESVREHLLPFQDGQGHWEGNIYWTRIRRLPDLFNEGSSSPTIIVPTCNFQRFIPQCLPALLESPNGIRQLCVVHTGQSSLPAIPAGNIGESATPLREIPEPVHGLLAGRHRGLAETKGSIVIYLDDDVRLPDKWLNAMLEPFADPAVHIVGCRYLPEYEGQPPDWLEQLWTENSEGRRLNYLSLLDYGTDTKEVDPTKVWGLCYAIRRQTLIKLGGFHPDAYPWELRRYRGDGESAPSRLARQLKLKAIYQGETAVFHQVPKSRMTVEYLARRAYLQGISDSYSSIRQEGHEPKDPSLRSRLDLLKSSLKTMLLRNKISVEAIRARIGHAYRQGFVYHQTEVRRDPALLQWVLRENYWNYSLPDGWESYVSSHSNARA
jgi:predicted O-methyltransferase YrrM/glycosyltransferase involved in cell wall biosynthesis